MTDQLFDAPAPEPEPVLSADRKRTRRQREALAAGQHPLTLPRRRPLALHPEAAPHDDRKAAGLRCGDCRWRDTGGYPKCHHPGMPRSHGAATDCRAWWPACIHHVPAEAAT